nr:pollen-specific leucine-rich repeat extensin-like protein 1 [Penaeus vannamei]
MAPTKELALIAFIVGCAVLSHRFFVNQQLELAAQQEAQIQELLLEIDRIRPRMAWFRRAAVEDTNECRPSQTWWHLQSSYIECNWARIERLQEVYIQVQRLGSVKSAKRPRRDPAEEEETPEVPEESEETPEVPEESEETPEVPEESEETQEAPAEKEEEETQESPPRRREAPAVPRQAVKEEETQESPEEAVKEEETQESPSRREGGGETPPKRPKNPPKGPRRRPRKAPKGPPRRRPRKAPRDPRRRPRKAQGKAGSSGRSAPSAPPTGLRRRSDNRSSLSLRATG